MTTIYFYSKCRHKWLSLKVHGNVTHYTFQPKEIASFSNLCFNLMSFFFVIVKFTIVDMIFGVAYDTIYWYKK